MKKLLLLFLFTGSLLQAQEIALLKYNGGGDWYANPTSLPNLIKFSNQNINTKIRTKTGRCRTCKPRFVWISFLYT